MNLERVNVNGLHSIRGQVALSSEQGNIPSRSIVGDYHLPQERLCFTELFDNICSVTLDKAVPCHKGIRGEKVTASHTLNLDSRREVSGQVHDPWYVLDWLLIGLVPSAIWTL